MSERGRERDRETHREKMRGSRGHMRALIKVSDGLMVIRFQCPTVARKEEAEFPILPSPAPPKLGCVCSGGWVNESGRGCGLDGQVREIHHGEGGFSLM